MKFPIYTRLYSYLKPYRGPFLLAIFFMVIFGASDGAVPFLVKYVLDGVFSQGDASLLYLLPVALIIFALVRGVCDFFQQFLMSRVGLWIIRDMRNQVHKHLLTLSTDFYYYRSSADIISRITSDVLLVKTLLTDVAAAVVRDLIRVVALLSAAIYLDPTLALIAAVVFPLGIYPVYRFGKRMRKLSRVGQEATGAISSIMQEGVVGNRVVKIFAREEFEYDRFKRENENLTRTFEKAEKVKAITGPVNEVLATLVICGVILYGGYSVIQNLRTQGEFIAFLLSVFLLYDPFKKLSRISSVVQQGAAGADRLFEILDTPPSIIEPQEPRRLGTSNDIEFEAVRFSYGGRAGKAPEGVGAPEELSEAMALADINLKIDEGRKVALVGFSGAGKSTLIDLIPRFIDPDEGVVRIGGVDVSKVSLRELRERIAMVSQHTFLFHDTVHNNIAYGNPRATPEQVVEAAKAAYAYEFITKFPRGFDTVVGESGLTLSGGERQRIAIARAILKNAPILILDEATASLDNRSEREVQAALESLEQGRTTIIIAHRLSTVRNADMVVVLKEGRIAEIGRHDELLAKGGEFAKLYALQFDEKRGLEEGMILN